MQRQTDCNPIETIFKPGLAVVDNLAWLNDALADIEAQRTRSGYVYLLHLEQAIGQAQSDQQRAEYGLAAAPGSTPGRRKDGNTTAERGSNTIALPGRVREQVFR